MCVPGLSFSQRCASVSFCFGFASFAAALCRFVFLCFACLLCFASPRLASPCSPYCGLPRCLGLLCFASFCLPASFCVASPDLALPRLASPHVSLSWVAVCFAQPCVAFFPLQRLFVPCLASSCLALPRSASFCGCLRRSGLQCLALMVAPFFCMRAARSTVDSHTFGRSVFCCGAIRRLAWPWRPHRCKFALLGCRAAGLPAANRLLSGLACAAACDNFMLDWLRFGGGMLRVLQLGCSQNRIDTQAFS